MRELPVLVTSVGFLRVTPLKWNPAPQTRFVMDRTNSTMTLIQQA